MKRLFFLITIITIIIHSFFLVAYAEGEPVKVMSMHYDDASALVYITSKDSNIKENTSSIPQKIVKLSTPNRIYFDINNAILVGEKQQIVFEKSPMKEIRLAQFDTNPNIVRVVMTFEEDFDTSKVNLQFVDGNILVRLAKPVLKNNYFNVTYSDNKPLAEYSHIVANSQVIQKVAIPVNASNVSASSNVMEDIQKAFENSTLSNTDGKTYDTVVSVDLSSALKLRTKYFINQYMPKNNGILVSGLGQVTTTKMFYLSSPKRAVIDLPNSFLHKAIRNKDINLCPDGGCKDTAKIGQFDYNTARIVITSDNADKYIPIFSQDSQSIFLIDSTKLNHTSLASTVSNINKVFVKKVDSKTNELILSFTSPIVYSLLRSDNALNIYLFNVKSYNESDIIKTLNGSVFKNFTVSLLPQIGVKTTLPNISKDDIIKIEQSIDSKALKIIYTSDHPQQNTIVSKIKRGKTKDKVVIDPGHGGSDYGAIREGINEKDITLDVSKRVDAILRSKGYKTKLTRTDDTYVSLEDRVEISEKAEPEIFVSIHVNSAVSTDPSGVETHYYHDYSKELAETVHKHLAKELSTKNRGLFKSMFYVINHTTDPAILVEIGFLSNESERNELLTEARKQKTAKAIADGIIEYLKSKK